MKRAIWNGKLLTPKTDAGERRFALSPVLLEQLKAMAEFRRPEDYLFATSKGTPLQLNNVLNRHLDPLLTKLGIARGGFHAFGHGKASLMASIGAPAPVKRGRLGHASSLVTTRYEHVLGADDVRVSTEIGNLLTSRTATTAKQ